MSDYAVANPTHATKGKKTMYIISKFHDYYDCLMKQGMDKTLIYHRNEEYNDNLLGKLGIYRYYQEFLKKTVSDYVYLPNPVNARGHSYSYATIDTGLLGFCGKQYLVIIFQYNEMPYLASCIYPRWIDTLKQTKLDGYRKNTYLLIEKSLTEQTKPAFYTNRYGGLAVNEKNILTTLNTLNGSKINDELFIELNCPVFFMYQPYNGNTVLIKNPPLKPFDFQCVLSPELCFQEIAHYIGNFLTKTDNPLQITDNKILCAAKGFDVKTSFRKPPTKL
ncbi:MAG: hypothetical protein LUQ28_14520 [Methylococcaceae bacterium]|nr:hypothetical protein [Methylococcaceae bacterium]